MINKYWRPAVASFLFVVFLFSVSSPLIGKAQTPNHHPVILVHGIGGKADTYWNEENGAKSIYQTLSDNGYDMDLVIRFAYPADSSGQEYPFASVIDAAEKLKQEIDDLRSRSGSDTVDIVAHSLGGIITRQYMKQYPNHHIRKFVDLATPHSGSEVMGFYNSTIEDIATFNHSAQPNSIWDLYIKPKISQGLNDLAHDLWKNHLSSTLPDPTSPAAKQLDPNSSFIRDLNQMGNSPSDAEYYLLYGDIFVNLKMNFFGVWAELNNLASVGDLVMATQNASTIPNIVNSPNFSSYIYQKEGFDDDLDAKVEFYIDNWDPVITFAVTDPLKMDTWHNGLLRNPNVNQKILSILNNNFTPPITITPTSVTSTPPISYGNSSTVMLFDVSGSMGEQDSTGVTKLDAAKGAGGRILDIIQAENSAAQGAQVGILSFSSSAGVNSQLSVDVDSVRFALDNLYASGGTGMPDGLRLSIDQFTGSPDVKPIIIMLSDGLPNIGLNGEGFLDETQVRQQVLDLASEAGNKNICIYTVGFGVPNTTGNVSGEASIDEDFLKQVSANSGCGAYYNAQNATDLANVYVGLRHESTGNVLLKKTGEIAQGQTVDIGAIAVPQGQNELLVTLNWPGSQLDPVLRDPAGKIIDQNYPGATFYQSKSLASVIIQNPLAGNWNLSAIGMDVPEGKTVYNAVVSSRSTGVAPTPTPGGNSGLALVIIFMAMGGLIVYMVTVTSRRGRQFAIASGNASMIALSGQSGGRLLSLSDNYLIGRGSECQVRLSDRSVSRQHARIRYANGRWYIQDLKSAGGTYLNGTKISASPLKPGDRIHIGSTEFEFRT